MSSPVLDAALDYAERGWAVFPLNGKVPTAGSHGFKDATTDECRVEAWWRKGAADVGIATGKSGLLVLDVDPRHGGEKALRELEQANGELPKTVRVKTGGGGEHIYFRNPGDIGSAANKLGPGLDVKGHDGYVVAPPSTHKSGKRYEWIDPPGEVDVAEAPDWIISLCERGQDRANDWEPTGREPSREVLALLEDDWPMGEQRWIALRVTRALLDEGRSTDDIVDQVVDALERSEQDPGDPWTRDQVEALVISVASDDPPRKRGEGKRRASVRALPYSSVEPEQVAWFWLDLIPFGMLTLLVGDPGLGKSALTTYLAAKASLDEMNSILLSAEDHKAVTIRPRLEVAEANLDRVHHLEVKRDDIEDGIALPDDAQILEEAIRESGARLLVVDPLTAHLPEAVNSWRDQSIRRALAPLHRIAENYNCAVVIVVHLNKSSATADPLYRTGGSIGIPAAVRSALLLARDPDDPEGDRGGRRILAHVKCNVGTQAESIACEVATKDLAEGISAPLIRFLGPSPITGSELLRPAENERSARDSAGKFLVDELIHGPRSVKELKASAKDAGLSWPTVTRAKADLGVKARKINKKGGKRGEGHWEWRMP